MKQNIELYNTSPMIYNPHYVGEGKNVIRAIIRFRDGKLTEIEEPRTKDESEFMRDLFSQYDESEIEQNTIRENHLRDLREAIAKQAAEDQARELAREALFQAKAQAMEIPAVKTFVDKTLTSKIRRAKSPTEVYALVAQIFIQSTAVAPERASG